MYFYILHSNSLCVCWVKLLASYLPCNWRKNCVLWLNLIVAPLLINRPLWENKCFLQTTLFSVLTKTHNQVPVFTSHYVKKDVFRSEVIQTVIYHLREQSLRTEVEGSVKDECLTNAISNSYCVFSGTWTESGALDGGHTSRFFFSLTLQKNIAAVVLAGAGTSRAVMKSAWLQGSVLFAVTQLLV